MKLTIFMKRFGSDEACRAHEFRWNTREADVIDRIGLIGQHGKLSWKELTA